MTIVPYDESDEQVKESLAARLFMALTGHEAESIMTAEAE
jgi:hypothetical protein